MKLQDYKEREIPGWHEPNVTTKQILRNEKGKIIGAYFPEITPNIKFLIDYIIDGGKYQKKSLIPHVYGDRQLESIFFGGLRTDGSIGRHCAMIAAYHKEKDNHAMLSAISLLSDLGVEFASRENDLKPLFEKMKLQQKLKCNADVCISDHYTSGSINFNGLLGLHFDTASLPDVYNVIFWRVKGEGGHLIIPQHGLVIESKSYSMALLNVRENMHGVTAFKGESRDSIVFYGVNGME